LRLNKLDYTIVFPLLIRVIINFLIFFNNDKIHQTFLRLAVSTAMLSAVADRFGLAMFTSVGLKATFDYSVWNAVGACLAISCLKEKYREIDSVIK